MNIVKRSISDIACRRWMMATSAPRLWRAAMPD
jgi:hypothetical protein